MAGALPARAGEEEIVVEEEFTLEEEEAADDGQDFFSGRVGDIFGTAEEIITEDEPGGLPDPERELQPIRAKRRP